MHGRNSPIAYAVVPRRALLYWYDIVLYELYTTREISVA